MSLPQQSAFSHKCVLAQTEALVAVFIESTAWT